MKRLKTAAIIGYGSIGRRHASVLKKLKLFEKIYIVTNQKINLNFEKLNSINNLKDINPDYFVICSDTSKHYKQLKYIINNFKRKIIFVEKPIFEKSRKLKIGNNKVFVGYNFRFNPLTAVVLCGSYLPNWRKNIKYNKSYSSYAKKGGGVLLDLSHEFDYITWIFGFLKKYYSYYNRISNLNISSNDFLSFIGSAPNAKYVQINLDYFSRIAKRKIILEGGDFSLQADILKNYVKYNYLSKTKLIKFTKLGVKNSYFLQHKNILIDKKKIACTYVEATKLMRFLDKF